MKKNTKTYALGSTSHPWVKYDKRTPPYTITGPDPSGCDCHPECVSAVLPLYFLDYDQACPFCSTPSLHVLVKFENTVLVFFSELDIIDSRKVASRILGFYLVPRQQIYKNENSIVPSSMANFIQLENHTT